MQLPKNPALNNEPLGRPITVVNIVRFFWFLAAIIFLLAGVGWFGENLIICAALGGASLSCVVLGMEELGGGKISTPDADSHVFRSFLAPLSSAAIRDTSRRAVL